jgi:hypothetical protein
MPRPTAVWLHPSPGAMAHAGAIASLPTRFRLVASPNEARIVVVPAAVAALDPYRLDRQCELVLTDIFQATRTQLDDARAAGERVRIGEPSLIAAADLMPYCADAYGTAEPTIMEVTIDVPGSLTTSARLAEAAGVVAALGVPLDSEWTITSTSGAVAATALWRNNTLAIAHRMGTEPYGAVSVSITSVRQRILARGYFGGSARPARLQRHSADGQVENRPTFASPLRQYWTSAREGLWPQALAGMAVAGQVLQ